MIQVLHTIFLTVIGIVIAVVSAKSYLRQGNLVVILLGAAFLTFTIVTLVGAILSFGIAPLLGGGVFLSNYGTIINNTSIFASSGVFVASAVLALVVVRPSENTRRKKALVGANLGVVLFVIGLTAVTFSGVMPTF